MTKRPIAIKTAGRTFFFAALISIPAGMADASGFFIEAQCDAAAGSRRDHTRNTAFAPVDADEIRIGVALSACREAYNAGGGPRTAFQLARALERGGQQREAMKLYGEAARKGHAAAMVAYADMLAARGDHSGASELYRKAAEADGALAAIRDQDETSARQ